MAGRDDREAAVKKMLGWIVVAALMCLIAASTAFVQWFMPQENEWSMRISKGPLWIEVSVPAVLRAATHPATARWLDGQRLPTRYGVIALQWDAKAQTLHARCAPCKVQSRALSTTPIQLDALEITAHREADMLTGTVLAKNAGSRTSITGTWQGALTPRDLALQLTVPQAPIADFYALLDDAVNLEQSVRIDGTAAFELRLTLSQNGLGNLSVQPHISGFAVYGLGTEALLTAQTDARCNATPQPVSKRVSKPSRSDWLARAVMAAEDQRFYEHTGYDLEEMLAALEKNGGVNHITRGGSTLSQQLAKMMFTGDERTHARKLRELLYAVEMERTLGKGRILQLYLAIAPWGHNLCGAHAAAQTYLGKQVAELNPIEAAWLAGMLRNPQLAASRFKQNGAIDVPRTQIVLEGMRPLRKSQRQKLVLQVVSWRPTNQ
jgi:penicillin-binding protein 1A